jgi:methionyl-tRNA formyltransferase
MEGAAALERRVRAFQPWPGTFLETAAGRIAVHAARVAPRRLGDEVGRLVAHEDTFAVVAADARLVVEIAQAPGGRRMTGAELLRGRHGLLHASVRGRAAELT